MALRDRLIGWLGGVPRDQVGSWDVLMRDAGFYAPTAAGVAVSAESALRLSTVYRCAAIIAGAIASFPCPVYRRVKEDRERATDLPVYWLLNERPTASWSAASWWEHNLFSMLLKGDGFAYIVRDGLNRATEFVPLLKSQVNPKRVDGEVVYDVLLPDGKMTRLDAMRILHFTMPGFDGLTSPSVVAQAARQTVGTSLATEEHAGRLFSNGGTQRVVLSYPNGLKEDQVRALRDQWVSKYGGPENAHLPLVLTNGGKPEAVSLSAVDQQLLESRRFHVEDIARAFGVPPHMIGHTDKTTSWGSGIQEMSIGFVKYTLQPHLTRIEQELNYKLFRQDRLFVEFLVEGLLRGDSKSRGEFYRQGIGGSQGPGWMTINEVRKLENLPKIGGGDELFKGGANAAQSNQPASAG